MLEYFIHDIFDHDIRFHFTLFTMNLPLAPSPLQKTSSLVSGLISLYNDIARPQSSLKKAIARPSTPLKMS